MMSLPTSLAIIERNSLFRGALQNFLSMQYKINVVLQTGDILELLNKLKSTSIHVLLVEIFAQDAGNIDVLKQICRTYLDTKILVLFDSDDIHLVSDLLDSGIHGYISKSEGLEDLVQAIRATAANELYQSRVFTEALFRHKKNNIDDCEETSMKILNERDKKILQLIWAEKSNKEIANELYLGVRSVEKIRQDIKEKIGVRSTVGLIKYAIHKKIIRTGYQTTQANSLYQE